MNCSSLAIWESYFRYCSCYK